MKKRTLSILLAVIMIVCMTTACASNDVPTTSPTYPTFETTEATTEPAPEPKVTRLKFDVVALSSSELLELSANQVQLSTEDLCFEDCQTIGRNFEFLMIGSLYAEKHSDETRNQIADDAYVAFGNVQHQAASKHFPEHYISSWLSVPHKNILQDCCYLFKDWRNITICGPIFSGYLSEQDAIAVASTLLGYYEIGSNSTTIYGFVAAEPYPEVQEMAVQKFLELSKTSEEYLIEEQRKFLLQFENNEDANAVLTQEKLDEIRDNIMKNRYFDFVEKYTTFCNSQDEDIAAQAFNRLLEVAKSTPDEATAEEIRMVAQKLWNVDQANELLLALNS